MLIQGHHEWVLKGWASQFRICHLQQEHLSTRCFLPFPGPLASMWTLRSRSSRKTVTLFCRRQYLFNEWGSQEADKGWRAITGRKVHWRKHSILLCQGWHGLMDVLECRKQETIVILFFESLRTPKGNCVWKLTLSIYLFLYLFGWPHAYRIHGPGISARFFNALWEAGNKLAFWRSRGVADSVVSQREPLKANFRASILWVISICVPGLGHPEDLEFRETWVK